MSAKNLNSAPQKAYERNPKGNPRGIQEASKRHPTGIQEEEEEEEEGEEGEEESLPLITILCQPKDIVSQKTSLARNEKEAANHS